MFVAPIDGQPFELLLCGGQDGAVIGERGSQAVEGIGGAGDARGGHGVFDPTVYDVAGKAARVETSPNLGSICRTVAGAVARDLHDGAEVEVAERAREPAGVLDACVVAGVLSLAAAGSRAGEANDREGIRAAKRVVSGDGVQRQSIDAPSDQRTVGRLRPRSD